MKMIKDDIPTLPIRIDRDGLWYYQGAQMFRKDILQLFFENLKRDEQGRFLVEYQGDKCLIEVEDTPIVVETVERNSDSIEIFLSDFSSEILNPATLHMNAANVLYCSIKDGLFEARFLRAAYYQLAEFIEHDESENRYFIVLNGEKHYIESR